MDESVGICWIHYAQHGSVSTKWSNPIVPFLKDSKLRAMTQIWFLKKSAVEKYWNFLAQNILCSQNEWSFLFVIDL